MRKFFFDIDKKDTAFTVSDKVAIKPNGDILVRLSDHVVMDYDSGEIHMISGWKNDDDDKKKKRR